MWWFGKRNRAFDIPLVKLRNEGVVSQKSEADFFSAAQKKKHCWRFSLRIGGFRAVILPLHTVVAYWDKCKMFKHFFFSIFGTTHIFQVLREGVGFWAQLKRVNDFKKSGKRLLRVKARLLRLKTAANNCGT